jgi:hypothetical protein
MTFKTRQRIALAVFALAIMLLLRSAFLNGREDAGRVPAGAAAPWQMAGFAALATGTVVMWWASRAPERPKRR